MEREANFRFGEGIYKDTGCELHPTCCDCTIPLERCPAQIEARHWIQGELDPRVVKHLTALRIAAGGDILDEGSPMNLRWKKYWAEKGITV
jgi:hypothetical protein